MSKDGFIEICKNALTSRGFDKDEKFVVRFRWEIQEIILRQEWEYFWNLYQNGVKFPKNENNLLVCFLLDIVPDFDINFPPNCEYGEFPDIDVDYIPAIRDYLKNTWVPEKFGEEFVCNIGNYTTFGIKSALIDMVRVHGLNRDEVLVLTKDIELRDEDGKLITWDGAMKTYPKLKEFCDKHPEVAVAAQKLLNRNRGMGVHAGGLIISSSPLNDLVPLVKRKDNPQASAWPEGLHGQDLQPVGLVKFDLLVISNLLQIARCCEIVKQRHNLDGICNLDGQADWTDVPKWRNDAKALEMANKGDLKCIFQFDSDGIRNLVRSGGVDSFEDLVAYTAIYRPGPLGQKMHERYIQRKNKKEHYDLHPLMQPILGKTYGVLIYQEDLMKLLNVVGNIPLKDCEAVRKAISKKKIESFAKYKEMFLVNGRKNLNCSPEFVQKLYDQIEAFSEYGFNRCLGEFTLIETSHKKKFIRDILVGDLVFGIDERGNKVFNQVKNVFDQGIKNVFEVIFDDCSVIRCTLDHKFLTDDGQMPLWKIAQQNLKILSVESKKIENSVALEKLKKDNQNKTIDVSNIEKFLKDYTDKQEFFENYSYAKIHDVSQLNRKKILSIRHLGKQRCFDLEIDSKTHNFILDNGVVTSNSHAVAYTYISMWLLYLKAHFPHEFYTSILSCENLTDKIHQYRIEASVHGVKMNSVDINLSKVNFELVGNTIYYGISKIKGIGEEPAQKIVDLQPYKSFEDFLRRFGTDASVLKPLIALRCFKDTDAITLWKFAEHFKDTVSKFENKKKRFLESMQKYDLAFKHLVPNESRCLADFSEENPFDTPEWKDLLDHDELVDSSKEIECGDGEGSVKQIIKNIEVDSEDVFIENQQNKYFKKVGVKKVFNRWKELKKIWSRRKVSISKFKNSENFQYPSLATFDATQFEIDEKIALELRDVCQCERKYYGFAWSHPLESSPDFTGLTFDQIKHDTTILAGPVEIMVTKVTKCSSKNGKTYYQITAEDCTSQSNKINIWPDDYERWEDEIKEGNFLRVSLQPPSGGFATFLLQSNRHTGKNKWQQLKYRTKEDDPRIIAMKKKVLEKNVEEMTYLTDDEVLKQITQKLLENDHGK